MHWLLLAVCRRMLLLGIISAMKDPPHHPYSLFFCSFFLPFQRCFRHRHHHSHSIYLHFQYENKNGIIFINVFFSFVSVTYTLIFIRLDFECAQRNILQYTMHSRCSHAYCKRSLLLFFTAVEQTIFSYFSFLLSSLQSIACEWVHVCQLFFIPRGDWSHTIPKLNIAQSKKTRNIPSKRVEMAYQSFVMLKIEVFFVVVVVGASVCFRLNFGHAFENSHNAHCARDPFDPLPKHILSMRRKRQNGSNNEQDRTLMSGHSRS